MNWYWKDGTKIGDTNSERTMLNARLGDMAYKRVMETTLPNGKWVSTVWLGLGHTYNKVGPPLIFETMVFNDRDGPLLELDCDRYSTEEEARVGHEAMCEKWRKENANE